MSEINAPSKQDIENNVIASLRTVYDPEIPVNIYDMGLVYDIIVHDLEKVTEKDAENAIPHVEINMTLTSPSCPVAESLPKEVEEKIAELWMVKWVKVNVIWEPTWTKDMMSEEAKLELGFM